MNASLEIGLASYLYIGMMGVLSHLARRDVVERVNSFTRARPLLPNGRVTLIDELLIGYPRDYESFV